MKITKIGQRFRLKAVCDLIVLVAAVCLCVFASADIVKSGTCGDNVTWTLDDTGKLTLSGNGQIMSALPADIEWRHSIKSIVIEYGITDIPDYFFQGYNKVTSISIPGSVSRIGTESFSGCSHVTSISIPNSVTYIGDFAFSHCKCLTSLSISNGVTYIGKHAFCYCTGLTSVTIPESVLDLDDNAFEYCRGLTSVTMRAQASDISFFSVFRGCTNLTAVNIPSNHKLYQSKNGIVFSKEGDDLLFCPTGKTGSYSIPDTVTHISLCAFRNCTHLTSIIIPNSVESINGQVFDGCSSLSSVTMSHFLRAIGVDAFKNCALKSITLYGKIKYIGDNAFDQDVVIHAPKHSYVAQWAYDHYYTLKTFAPEYYVQIDFDSKKGTATASPAYGKKGTEVTLKATPKKGFKFKEWVVASGNVTIKNNKFTIGKNDVYIDACFVRDPTYAVVKGSEYKLDLVEKTAVYVCPEKKTITSVSIPATIKVDGVKYKVTEIAANAFKGCASLTKVTIGKNVAKIGKNAFNGCKKLKAIDIKTEKLTKKGIGSSCFKGIDAKAVFTVPKKMKKDYKAWLVKTGKAPKKAKFK